MVIADAGLSIPPETQRIDLALTEGIPTFLDTLRAVLTEMQVERAIVAEEMLDTSPQVYKALKEMLEDIPNQPPRSKLRGMTGISYPQNAASREESDPTQIEGLTQGGLKA